MLHVCADVPLRNCSLTHSHCRRLPNWTFDEIVLDESTHLGSPLSKYAPNFVKISWSGAEIRPQNEIRNWPSGGRIILLPVPILTSVIFSGPSYVWGCKNFKKIDQRAAELHRIQLFLYLHLNLHCQRHNHTVPSCISIPTDAIQLVALKVASSRS